MYQVRLQGDTLNITDPSPSCPGVSGVRDLTSLLADLSVGNTYQISYTVNTCAGQYPVSSGAWIDFNANGVFETFEALFNFSTLFGTQTWSFSVPSTATLGNTRLRVQVQEYGGSILYPCDAFNYGATSDFTVAIKSTTGGGYCESGPTTGNDMNLGPVQLSGFTMTINETSDCPTTIGPKDLTTLVADMNEGSSYTLNYQITDCNEASTAWPTLSGAWIDFDQDGVFEDWELLGSVSKPGLAAVSIPFTVPFGTIEQEVVPGNTVLRVQVQETNAEFLDPCAHFAWGGTKDFGIRIWEPKTYCVSGPLSTTDTALGTITLIGQTTSINDVATCADVQVGPIDHTLMVADVYVAQPYTITYDVITCGTKNPTMSAAWVDYNHNEILESWEQITPRSNAFGTVSYTFKVPPSAPNQVVAGGPTRLRVQVQQTSENKVLDPCALFNNGGTRDFTLNILNNTLNNEEQEQKARSFARLGGRAYYAKLTQS